ncbi:LON peptidase substrate-binding domain-containing protein [Polynucleobacter rarus]|uniref:LON peptidase substrate-binding domain-containing protein n=1 Tax=Polynucleobacter rarus TaxID=556055 RepID=UPI000D3EC521|nr:LON peptidase substrate-binding domain-containing protein [Polynucleobacter rarus]
MTLSSQIITIPLFPLSSTLFPKGVMELQIFEVRYLNMIKDCVKTESPFGIVTLNSGGEVRSPVEEVHFSQVGTLANIDRYDPVQANLYFIRCSGGARFKVINSEKLSNGQWQAEVNILLEDQITPIPNELKVCSSALSKVIDSMKLQGVLESQMPFQQPYLLQDCGWVANRWAELLPLNSGQKEHLLGIENPRLRLDLILDLLDEMNITNM